MTGLKPRSRPELLTLGFLVPLATVVAAVAVYTNGLFNDLGWRGGEYLWLIIGVLFGNVVLGSVLRIALDKSEWRSFGSGVLIGSTLGVVVAFVLMTLFVYNVISKYHF